MIWLRKLNFLTIGWIPGVGWWASTRYQRTRQSINAGSDQTRAFLLHHSHHLLQASSCSYPHSISPDSMQSCRSAILTMYFKRALIKKTDCSLSLRFAHDKIFVQIIWRGLHWSIRRLRCTQSRASFLTNSEGLVLTISGFHSEPKGWSGGLNINWRGHIYIQLSSLSDLVNWYESLVANVQLTEGRVFDHWKALHVTLDDRLQRLHLLAVTSSCLC